jgi:hypothetical protein
MNWYKKAKIDNYPIWLSQKLMEETDQYQNVKSKIYPEAAFKPQDIQLVEDWIKETNPDFENLSLSEAIKKSKIHYENKKLPPKLNVSDINTNNLILTLLDAMNTFGGQEGKGRVDPKSITIKSIRSIYPDVSKIQQQTFNYVVSVEFKTIKPNYFLTYLNNDLHQKGLAQLVTKDGQYFSISSYEKIT